MTESSMTVARIADQSTERCMRGADLPTDCTPAMRGKLAVKKQPIERIDHSVANKMVVVRQTPDSSLIKTCICFPIVGSRNSTTSERSIQRVRAYGDIVCQRVVHLVAIFKVIVSSAHII